MESVPNVRRIVRILVVITSLSGCSASPEVRRGGGRLHDFYSRAAGEPRSEARAGDLPPRPSALPDATLDDYVRFGLANSAALRAAFERWLSALEQAPQASSLPDPQVSYLEFVEELQTRTGPHPRRFGVGQTFPWFGKRRLREKAALEGAEALWNRAEAEALRVREAIEVAFHEYAYNGSSERVSREALALLRQLEPVVRRRVESGATQEDLLRLQMEIAVVEERLAELVARSAPLSAALAAAMSWKSTESLPRPGLEEPVPVELGAEELVAAAMERNPALRALGDDVARARTARELAGLRRYPDLTVGVDYLQVDEALMPGTPGSGDDPWGVRVALNVPLWSAAYDAAERESEHALRAATLAAEDFGHRLAADVQASLFRLDDAARDLALHRDTLLPRARDTYELTLASYRAGSSSVLDLIDSERLILDFQLGYWQACRNYMQHEARLRTLVGGTPE